ncbi:MAG: mannonate dehydratase [Clostridia bacterium]|nr:mannonate dehydratase [Clostridia bacterium]
MKVTFRWFGRNDDSVPLEYIRQIPGCEGLMGAMGQFVAGEVWPEEDIKAYAEEVHAAGLKLEVIESVNVHEDIKLGLPGRDRYIDNYIVTLRRLAKYGVKLIVYNFMPVLDWLRTDLDHVNSEDGSRSMFYDDALVRDITPDKLPEMMLSQSNGFSLPGWEPERVQELGRIMDKYKGMTPDDLRQNLRYFFQKIIPVCEELGLRMAMHPDDPAWPIFGLPRIAHSQEDFDKIVALCDSPANSICLCTGSLGSVRENDVPAMIRHFGKMNRIGCVHLRNIKFMGERTFRESSHLSADGDLDMYEIVRAVYDTCPDTYMRPDHGRMIWGETGRPGYGLYDRALGIAYINGLWEAIDKERRRER